MLSIPYTSHVGMRRVWQLPNTTNGDMLTVISDSTPVFDGLCWRFINISSFWVWTVVLIKSYYSLGLILKRHAWSCLWVEMCIFVRFTLVCVWQHLILGCTNCEIYSKFLIDDKFLSHLPAGCMIDQAC